MNGHCVVHGAAQISVHSHSGVRHTVWVVTECLTTFAVMKSRICAQIVGRIGKEFCLCHCSGCICFALSAKDFRGEFLPLHILCTISLPIDTFVFVPTLLIPGVMPLQCC